MEAGYMYILKCSNGAYYTGSTKNLQKRLMQHQAGEGANFTKKHLPVELVYFEAFSRIDQAFYREKQVQGWSRKKKEALINGEINLLQGLSECKNETNYKNLKRALRLIKIGTSASLSAPISLSAQYGTC
jgi:predicted GIY-YIG superfamily endonuclease